MNRFDCCQPMTIIVFVVVSALALSTDATYHTVNPITSKGGNRITGRVQTHLAGGFIDETIPGWRQPPGHADAGSAEGCCGDGGGGDGDVASREELGYRVFHHERPGHGRAVHRTSGPVHTYIKTDKNAHFKWGVRHFVGNKYAR